MSICDKSLGYDNMQNDPVYRTYPMETVLRKLEDIFKLTPTAAEGMASFVVEFDVSQELNKALSDVREAIDAARAGMPAKAP